MSPVNIFTPLSGFVLFNPCYSTVFEFSPHFLQISSPTYIPKETVRSTISSLCNVGSCEHCQLKKKTTYWKPLKLSLGISRHTRNRKLVQALITWGSFTLPASLILLHSDPGLHIFCNILLRQFLFVSAVLYVQKHVPTNLLLPLKDKGQPLQMVEHVSSRVSASLINGLD